MTQPLDPMESSDKPGSSSLACILVAESAANILIAYTRAIDAVVRIEVQLNE